MHTLEAEARHIVEQTLGLGEELKSRGPRHIVFVSLGHRRVDDVGRGLQCGFEEGLVGLELLPRVEGAAGRRDRKQEKYSGKPRPDSTAPRLRARSARRKTSSEPSPVKLATILTMPRFLPSALSRKSAPRIVIGQSVTRPSALNSKRNAAGKLSGAVPSMITGITGRCGCRDRKSRTSSLTVGRPAATGEHSTISAAEASSAAIVASVSEWPPEKSSRSRKIGHRSVVQELLADRDSQWHEYRGRGPITKNQVAALLRDYDIRPVVLHPTKRADFSRHGYTAAQFQDAFARFLPLEPNIRTLKRGRESM
jgi:hypothetical protein